MNWQNLLNFINSFSQGINQVRDTRQGQEMQNLAENSEITIKTRGDEADLQIKGMPKSLFMGTRNLQPDINQMYNMNEPKKYEELNPVEKAKIDAQIEMAGQEPEEPEKGLMGFLKSIPLGGFRFDRRLGWGNVINALIAGSIGQEMIKEKYEREKENYIKTKNQLARQLMEEQISLEEYTQKMKQRELELKRLEATQQALYKPIDVEQFGEQVFGDKELAKDMRGLAMMFGYGEIKDGRHYVNPLELNMMEQNIRQIFPQGLPQWMLMRLKGRLAEAKGEEKAKLESQISLLEQSMINPTVLAQLERSREKQASQEELANQQLANKMKYADYLNQLKKEYYLWKKDIDNKEQKGQDISGDLHKQYNNYLNQYRQMVNVERNFLKEGITDENREDYENVKAFKMELLNKIKEIEERMKQLEKRNKGATTTASSSGYGKFRQAFVNFIKNHPNFSEQEIQNYLLRYAKYNKLDIKAIEDYYKQLKLETGG
ncbi:MAG: hypothetical protein QXV73_04530 [Candidatus Micrarchaeia archaeon]